jgi:hypothetical protein
MIEGAVKLGQTLWRRLLPEELSRADAHLNDILYTFLEVENWNRAMVFGEFAAGQPKASTDLRRKMFLVNYAIALKFGGREDKARDILANIDWTAASNDFKLAQAVILEQYDAAAEIMRKIGTAGELVSEHSYHLWPLFHDFRESDPFHRGYAAVYGYPFKEEFKKVIAAARAGELKELEHGAATERNRG